MVWWMGFFLIEALCINKEGCVNHTCIGKQIGDACIRSEECEVGSYCMESVFSFFFFEIIGVHSENSDKYDL